MNLTSINSKLNTFAHDSPIFHIDVEGEPDSPAILNVVDKLRTIGARADIMPPRQVPWFPVNIRDLDLTRETLDAEVSFGMQLQQYDKETAFLASALHYRLASSCCLV